MLIWPAGPGLAAVYRRSATAAWGSPMFVAGGVDVGGWEPTQLLAGIDQSGTAHAAWDAGDLPDRLRSVDVGASTTGLTKPHITISILSRTRRAVTRARALRVRVRINGSGYLTLGAATSRPQVRGEQLVADHPRSFSLHLSNAVGEGWEPSMTIGGIVNSAATNSGISILAAVRSARSLTTQPSTASLSLPRIERRRAARRAIGHARQIRQCNQICRAFTQNTSPTALCTLSEREVGGASSIPLSHPRRTTHVSHQAGHRRARGRAQ